MGLLGGAAVLVVLVVAVGLLKRLPVVIPGLSDPYKRAVRGLLEETYVKILKVRIIEVEWSEPYECVEVQVGATLQQYRRSKSSPQTKRILMRRDGKDSWVNLLVSREHLRPGATARQKAALKTHLRTHGASGWRDSRSKIEFSNWQSSSPFWAITLTYEIETSPYLSRETHRGRFYFEPGTYRIFNSSEL